MLKFSLPFILFILVSCEAPQQKFNRIAWNHIDGSYNHRDLMIQDLMKNILHKGMTFKELEKILGKPNEQTFRTKVSYELYYNFYQEKNRELIIYFSKDSCVTNFARVIRKRTKTYLLLVPENLDSCQRMALGKHKLILFFGLLVYISNR